KARRAFFKFATKLFSERAGHASARAHKDCIDRSDAAIIQAEPGEGGRVSDQGNHRYSFYRNSACAEVGHLLGTQREHTVSKQSDGSAPARKKNCRLQRPISCR